MVSQDIQEGKNVAGNQQLTHEKAMDVSPMEVFYSYSHKDGALRDDIEKHLSILKLQ